MKEIDLEQLMSAFQIEEEEEPEKKQIDRGQWMTLCQRSTDVCTGQMMKNLQQLRSWEMKALEYNSLKERVFDLEDNNFRIDFFVDEQGTLSFEAHPKDHVGFTH
jgi:hypothetical protein